MSVKPTLPHANSSGAGIVKTLHIKGHVVVADAMNCQKETAEIIIENERTTCFV